MANPEVVGRHRKRAHGHPDRQFGRLVQRLYLDRHGAGGGQHQPSHRGVLAAEGRRLKLVASRVAVVAEAQRLRGAAQPVQVPVEFDDPFFGIEPHRFQQVDFRHGPGHERSLAAALVPLIAETGVHDKS